MRMLPSANPGRYQHRDPSVVTTYTHARCRNVRKPGPRPMSARSCPAPTMTPRSDRPFGHRPPCRIRPDTVHPPDTPWPAGSDADRERTNGTEGVRTPWIATTTRRAARTRRAPPVGRRLRLGNQGRLGDGKITSATLTTAATGQLLGVALPSKPRLGALLSSDDFGSRVGRRGGCHPVYGGGRTAEDVPEVVEVR
jgi:hypothetical protein